MHAALMDALQRNQQTSVPDESAAAFIIVTLSEDRLLFIKMIFNFAVFSAAICLIATSSRCHPLAR